VSGSPARTATAEDLFERRVPHLYHLADDSAAIAAACNARAGRFHGGGTLVVSRSDDPCVSTEVHVTTYHVPWESAHVFVEHPGLLAPEVTS